MKRDDDFIRDLLIGYEGDKDWLLMMPGDTLGAGKEARRERGHVLLMMDQGLISEVGKGTFRLTSAGHDYLSAIRSDGIWEQTKAAVAETGGNATLDIIKQLVVGFLKKKGAQQTGIDI